MSVMAASIPFRPEARKLCAGSSRAGRQIVVAWCVLLLWAAMSHAAAPQLQQVAPQGGQRGTEVEVTLTGPRLGQDPQEVLWHEPGVEVTNIAKVDGNKVTATFKIPDSCSLGRHAMRLRTASGISNLVTFHVGTLPEITEAEPNSQSTEPQNLEIDPTAGGVTISGVVTNEDVDFFAFEAKAGEPISVEVEGLRMGRTFFDPVITLYDPAGGELASCDDWPLLKQDASLSLLAPVDGKYLLELRESAYRGNGNATYRLHVGKFPRPQVVYPPGGQVGQDLALKWIGDATPDAGEEITLPAEPTGNFAYFPTDAGETNRGIAPSPHPLKVVDMPVAGEAEPNNNRNQATAAEAYGAMYGVLSEPGDTDYFRFAAKKGQVLQIKLHARSIGSPLDGVLRLLDKDGKRVAGNDDNSGQPDSYIEYTAPADGDYYLEVSDHLKRGDPTFAYWVEVLGPVPHVELALEEQQRYVAKLFDVPQGNRNAAVMRATRRRLGGELQFDWKNLPEGVAVEMFPLAGDYNRLPVVFTATVEAPLGQGLATVSAKQIDDAGESKPVTVNLSQLNSLIRGQNNVEMWGYTGSRAVVAVTEQAPYSIRIVEPKSPLVQRGSKNLRIVAEREEGFDEAILVRTLYNPPGVSANNSLRIKKGETEATIPITANDKAKTGDWKIVVRGQANHSGPLVTATAPINLTITTPYVTMKLPRLTVEQGGTIKFPITIEHNTPFEGEASVELVRLPPGVTTSPQTITSETKELTFELNVAGDARPGQHKGIFCRVTVPENGEGIVHSVGYGELRVDTPLPPETGTQAAR